MQRPDLEGFFYCVLCTTVKHFGAVVMKVSVRSVSGREGSSFLAVGVGDDVFARKSMSLGPMSSLSLCLIQKNYFRSNCCKYFLLNGADHVRMLLITAY